MSCSPRLCKGCEECFHCHQQHGLSFSACRRVSGRHCPQGRQWRQVCRSLTSLPSPTNSTSRAAEVQYHRFHFKPALMDATHRHIKTPPGPTPPGGWIVGSSVENIVPWPPFGGGRAVVAPAVAGQANLSNSSQMPRPTAPIPRAVAVPSAPKGLSGSVSAINQALSNNTSRLWESPVHSSRALAVQSATKRLPSSVFKANQTIVNNASQIQGPEPPSSRSIAVLSTPRALLGSVPATLAAGSSQGQIPKLRGGQVPSRDTALASWGLPGSQGLSKVIEPGRSAAQPHSLAALQPQLDGSTVSITPKDVVVTVDANGVHVQNITTMTFASMEHAAEYFNAQARLCGQWATQALLFSSSKLGNNSNQPSERVVPQPSTIGKQKQVESSPLAGADNRTDLTRKKTPRMLAGATASPLTHTHTANFVTSISSPPPQILFSEPTSSAQLLLNQPSLISPRERQGIPTALELDYDHPSQDKCTTTNPFLGEFGCASGIESYRPLHSSGLSTEVDSYRPSHSSAHLTDLDSYRPSDFSSRSTEGDTNRPFLPQSRAAVDASPRKADSAPIINPRAAVSEFILAARGSSSPDASLLMLPPLPSPAYAESVLPLTLERKDRRIVGVDAAANSEE